MNIICPYCAKQLYIYELEKDMDGHPICPCCFWRVNEQPEMSCH